MTLAIGTDIVQIPRIEKILDRYGQRFLSYAFTQEEQQIGQNISTMRGALRDQACYFAKRFAAKEAFVKAMGTGFTQGISLRHISVSNDTFGKPILAVDAQAQKIFTAIFPHNPTIHLSLSDDYPTALAFVVID